MCTEDGKHIPFANAKVQQLTMNPSFSNSLYSDIYLYPKHAVFLAPKSLAINHGKILGTARQGNFRVNLC
jgi:hypothetical protein